MGEPGSPVSVVKLHLAAVSRAPGLGGNSNLTLLGPCCLAASCPATPERSIPPPHGGYPCHTLPGEDSGGRSSAWLLPQAPPASQQLLFCLSDLEGEHHLPSGTFFILASLHSLLPKPSELTQAYMLGKLSLQAGVVQREVPTPGPPPGLRKEGPRNERAVRQHRPLGGWQTGALHWTLLQVTLSGWYWSSHL